MKQREIKFRAWDEDKHMFTPDSIEFDVKGKHTVVWQTYKGKRYWGYLGSSVIALMQFTGLVDKNGKEIYEGDIVKTKSEGTFEVKWGNIGCDYHGGIGFSMGSEHPISSFYEVIGNIYEDPEVLEKI